MKYYFSGSNTLNEIQLERLVPMCPCRLLSVHGPFMSTAHQWLQCLPRMRISTNEIMLDSGAFTAWNQGKPTNLEHVINAYDAILGEYSDRVKQWWLINLDVIPGSRGVPATPEQMQQAMVDSDANYQKLQQRFGDIVLPVYHQFEPASRLAEVARQNPKYICVSPQNDVAEPLRLKFAQSAHEALRTISPGTDTHGLAATGMRMMTRVPWYSADSITWLYQAALGKLLFYDGQVLHIIKMSERDVHNTEDDWSLREQNIETKSSKLDREHWKVIHPTLRAAIVAAAQERGYSLEKLQNEHRFRAAFNMETIFDMIARIDRKVVDQGDMFSHGEAGAAAVEVE